MDQKKVDQLFQSLSKDQKQQVERILSDKAQTEKLLNTPQAQALLKKLMGEK